MARLLSAIQLVRYGFSTLRCGIRGYTTCVAEVGATRVVDHPGRVNALA